MDADTHSIRPAFAPVTQPQSPSVKDFGNNQYPKGKLAFTLQKQMQLVNNESPNVKKTLAKSRFLYPQIQKALAVDQDRYARATLADNPTLLPELQSLLANDDDHVVRGCLARNPTLLRSTQAVLSKDKSSHVRGWLAGNHAISTAIQMLLSRDSSRDVRESLARWATTARIQIILVGDEDPWVRLQLARNAHLALRPAIILYFDSSSNDKDIRSFLQMRHPKRYHQIARLEKELRQGSSFDFIALAPGSQQAVVIKNAILNRI